MTDAPLKAELIVSPSWLITINEAFDIFEDYSLVIKQGKILDILPTQQALKSYEAKQLDLKGHALLPGFINTHTHAAMSLLRGYAEDQPLQNWLQQSIWPVEEKWVSDAFVRDGSLLACAEMLKSGTTTFNDMYFFPNVAAQVAEASGMRACLSFPVLEFPTTWAKNVDEYLNKGLALQDHYKHHSRITTAFGPHAPYTVNLSTMERISTLAEELDTNIHIHLHENQQEVKDYQQEHGMSAIEHYGKAGLLSPRLQAVHMTQLTAQEIELIKKYGVQVSHCPVSNMKLASGICPISTLLENNVNVALGSDGAASNNDLDMIGEMKTAGLLAKVMSGDATTLSASTLLRTSTINGAKLLGIDQHTGSLEVGKFADMIAINLEEICSTPVYNPLSSIIYSASKSQVSYVWVEGECLLNNKQLTHIDEKEVIKKTLAWQEKIKTSVH